MIVLDDGIRTYTLMTDKPHSVNGLSTVKLFELSQDSIDGLQAVLNSSYFTLIIKGELSMKVAIVKDEKGSATNGGGFYSRGHGVSVTLTLS